MRTLVTFAQANLTEWTTVRLDKTKLSNTQSEREKQEALAVRSNWALHIKEVSQRELNSSRRQTTTKRHTGSWLFTSRFSTLALLLLVVCKPTPCPRHCPTIDGGGGSGGISFLPLKLPISISLLRTVKKLAVCQSSGKDEWLAPRKNLLRNDTSLSVHTHTSAKH